jgi:ankyrin repeat protein
MNISENDVYYACSQGDVRFITKFLESDLFRYSNQVSVTNMLYHACFNNKFEIVKCIFESPAARKGFTPLEAIRELIKTTCKKGNLEISKYLLDQPELRDEYNSNSDIPLLSALMSSDCGRLDILKYTLDSFPDNTQLNNALNNGSLINSACDEGRIEIIKYLLDRAKLDIHFNEEQFFRCAYDNNQFEVLRYFIFDLNLEKTKAIEDYMAPVFKTEVANMFELREINKSLNENLPVKSNSTKKPKV